MNEAMNTGLKRPQRIVLTGGPGGGKTTAADLFRRELGERVVIVPEAGTMLFMGGFPRMAEPRAMRATQTAIYHVQRNLEDVQAACFPERILLCDRGTIDGAAYWPGDSEDFFRTLNTDLSVELERYDAVVFFETGAAGGVSVIEGGNPVRSESAQQAVDLDLRLKKIWSQHKRFHFVGHQHSFLVKVQKGLRVLMRIVGGAQVL